MSEKIGIFSWGAQLIFLAVIFRVIAFFILRGQRKRKELYQMHTMGIIVEVSCEQVGGRSGRGVNCCFPVVEYQAGGKVVRAKSSFGISDKQFFRVGRTMELFYNPNECESFFIPELEKQYETVARVFIVASYIMAGVYVVICMVRFLT